MGFPGNISFRDNSQLVDATELAGHLKLDVRLVRRMAKQKQIPALVIRNGSRDYYRFHIDAVEGALSNEYGTTRVLPEGDHHAGPAQERP